MSKLMIGEIPSVIQEAYEVSPKNCLMFWGPPGIGKTEAVLLAVQQMKEKYGQFDVGIYITSQMESIDFSMPAIVENQEGVKTYVKLPISDFILKPGTRKILFFDELPNASGDVQKATQSILTDRKIHETKLPDEVMIIAAGNRKEDRAGSNGLLSALANRVEHWDCAADFTDWVNWAYGAGVHHSVVGYLKHFPANLNTFKAEEKRSATPRVWNRVSRYMQYYENNPSKHQRRRIESMIGPAITQEFMTFLRKYEKFPTEESILKKPSEAKLPEEGDIQFGIATWLFNIVDKKKSGAFAEYILRMNKEFQAMYFTLLRKHKIDCLIGQPLIDQWARENQQILKETQ